MVLGFFEFNQLRFKIKSSWVKRAAASFSLFLICPLVTHDSMCVCVWWEGLVRQHRWHTGGGRSWSRWSTLPCLRELDVGRKRRSECRLWCCFSSGRLVQPFTESLFVYSSGVTRPSALLEKVSLIRNSEKLPSQQTIFSCLVLQPTPLYSLWCRGLIQTSGINKLHFILPVWVGLITECCQRVADF